MDFVIEERYEHWGSDGKEFTKWFKVADAPTKSEAQQIMAQKKSDCEYITKKLKLKYEFQVRERSDEELKAIDDFWREYKEKLEKKKKEPKTKNKTAQPKKKV